MTALLNMDPETSNLITTMRETAHAQLEEDGHDEDYIFAVLALLTCAVAYPLATMKKKDHIKSVYHVTCLKAKV